MSTPPRTPPRPPLYRCAACDTVSVRRMGARCTPCTTARRPAHPLMLSSHAKSHAKRILKERRALARQNCAGADVSSAPRRGRPELACPDAPYETAVREIEQQSGRARTAWEPHCNHRLTLAANRRARELAGIPEFTTHDPKGVAA